MSRLRAPNTVGKTRALKKHARLSLEPTERNSKRGLRQDAVLPSPTVPRGRARDTEAALLWAAWKARQAVRDDAIVHALYQPDPDAPTPPYSAYGVPNTATTTVK